MFESRCSELPEKAMAPPGSLTKACQASLRNTRARRASRPPFTWAAFASRLGPGASLHGGKSAGPGGQRQAGCEALLGPPGAEGAGSGVTLPGFTSLLSALGVCVLLH